MSRKLKYIISAIGLTAYGLLQSALIAVKLIGRVDISWVKVFSPTIIILGLTIIYVVVCFMILIILGIIFRYFFEEDDGD